MTEPTPSPPEPTPSTNPPAPPQDGDGGDDTGRKGRRYADIVAQLHTAQQERDDMRARLDVHRTREVVRLAAEQLSEPADVFLDGRELSTFLGDDGEVDTAKVEAAVAALVQKRPGLKRQPRPTALPGGGAQPTGGYRPSLASALTRLGRPPER